MSDLQRVLSLVQTAMDEFDAPGTTLAGLVRRCQRIASLRGDAISLVWLDLEARDVSHEYQAGVEARADSLATRLIASLPPAVASEGFRVEYRAYLVRRRLRSDGEESSLDSVQQIEEKVRLLREQEAQLAPPPPGMHSYDLGKYVAEQQALRATLLAARPLFESILARVKDRLWVFLNETEHELTFGEAATETFDRLRSYVDGQLTTIAPLALEQFQTAYRRLNDGGSEDRAHAVTSCRRVLKTLADELYPARVEPVAGVDGKKHVLTDEAFVNRLLQYVSEAVGKHENGAVVQAVLRDVDGRLSALQALASKGVHADVTAYEVDTCVIQTYLLVADVLRIRERAAS